MVNNKQKESIIFMVSLLSIGNGKTDNNIKDMILECVASLSYLFSFGLIIEDAQIPDSISLTNIDDVKLLYKFCLPKKIELTINDSIFTYKSIDYNMTIEQDLINLFKITMEDIVLLSSEDCKNIDDYEADKDLFDNFLKFMYKQRTKEEIWEDKHYTEIMDYMNNVLDDILKISKNIDRDLTEFKSKCKHIYTPLANCVTAFANA